MTTCIIVGLYLKYLNDITIVLKYQIRKMEQQVPLLTLLDEKLIKGRITEQ